MSHRRSSSLSNGTGPYEDYLEVPSTAPPQRRRFLPSHSLSTENSQGDAIATPQRRRFLPSNSLSTENSQGDEDEGYSSSRRTSRTRQLASTALHAIGNRSEEMCDIFDEKCDYIENRPFAQSAKAKAHRAAEVIEDKVLKHVKVPGEVYEVLHGIENTQAYQTARVGVHRAYSYVEPILSRVNSVEVEDQVDFVIPPHLETTRGSISSSQSFRPTVPDSKKDFLPQIKVSDETGKVPVINQQLEANSEKDKPPDTASILSNTESETQYEIIKLNKFYKEPPIPKPVPRRKRSFRISSELSISNLAQEAANQANTENSKESSKENNLEKRKSMPRKSISEARTRKLQRQDTIHDLDSAKLRRARTLDISDREGSKDDDSLPKRTKIKGIPEGELKEQLQEKLDSVVCINGKTYIINKEHDHHASRPRMYGGASEFFEDSFTKSWDEVAGTIMAY